MGENRPLGGRRNAEQRQRFRRLAAGRYSFISPMPSAPAAISLRMIAVIRSICAASKRV